MIITTILISILTIPTPIEKGVFLCKQLEYEEGLAILEKISDKEISLEKQAELYFYRAVAAHHLSREGEAIQNADKLIALALSASAYIPERYIALAYAIRYDISTWNKNEENSLDSVARKMYSVKRRLSLNKGGKETQRQQKEILLAIEEKIKRIENAKKNKDKSTNNDDCPDGGEQPKTKEPQYRYSNRPLEKPTQGNTEESSGKVDVKKVKEVAEVWGKLPDKERAKALRELRISFPSKDKQVIEAYLREISKRSGRRD